jgi:hypothetical protein
MSKPGGTSLKVVEKKLLGAINDVEAVIGPGGREIAGAEPTVIATRRGKSIHRIANLAGEGPLP